MLGTFLAQGRRGATATPCFLGFSLARNDAFADVNRRGIEGGLDMLRIELLDHFDTGPSVLRDLLDMSALREPKTNIGVS
jgi:hypothetical protein